MKFVLHGGATSDKNLTESNRAFFLEMVKDFSSPRVLLVYFAREPQKYARALEQDKELFKQAAREIKSFSFTVASIKGFSEQAKHSDVIYVRGGDTRRLIESFKKIPNFTSTIKGKTYGGSSAGVNAIAQYYFSTNLDKVMQGLGVIPINSFPHWEESKQQKLKLLEAAGQDFPIYKLKEGEFAVLSFDI